MQVKVLNRTVAASLETQKTDLCRSKQGSRIEKEGVQRKKKTIEVNGVKWSGEEEEVLYTIEGDGV